MTLTFSDKQAKEIKHFCTQGDFFTLFEGAIRSGKSMAAIAAFFIYTQSIGKERTNIIAGRNLRVMQTETIQSLMDFAASLNCSSSYNRADGILIINNVKYFIVAAHDENSAKRIQGITAGTALVDEIQLIPQSFFEQLIGRLSFPDSRIIASCNPEGPRHWLKKDYIDKELVQRRTLFQLDDNPTLKEEVKERYKEMFSGIFYDRNIRGLWTQSQGIIYKEYKLTDKEVHESEINYIDIGIDYGIQTITAYQQLIYTKRGKCFVGASYRYNGRDKTKTDSQLVTDLLDWIKGYKNKVQRIYIDPSASSFITELRSRKGGINVIEADNKVVPGIKTVLNGFTSHNLMIVNNESNQALIDELGGYCWDDKEDDKPIKRDDHHCDALRYAYYSRNKNPLRRLSTVPQGL